MSFLLGGVIPAVWTPTDGRGKLLKSALRVNIEALIATGADSLLVLGSTGEFIHLSTDERKEVLDAAIEYAGSKPVLTNISHTNPRIVVDLGRHAKASGAAGVSLLAPWFFPMSEDDLVAFFVAAGDAVDLPLTLYNFYAMTGKKLTPDIVRRIGSETKISGLKHSAGEMEEHGGFVEVGKELGFNVVTGWDTHIPEAAAMGVKGVVAGLANVVPELVVKIFRLVGARKDEEAREPVRQMRKIGELVSTLEFPHNVAAAMEAAGREVGAPKTVMSSQTRVRYNALRENMRAVLKDFGYLA